MANEFNPDDYIEVSELDKEIAKSISDNTENKMIDLGSLTERYQRLNDEVESKRAEREQVTKDKDLKKYIDDNFGNQLKDPNAFYNLCKSRKAYEDNEIIDLIKMLPKQSKKGLFSRFIK